MRLSSHHFRSELRSPRRHSAQSSIAAMPQLTTAELNLIDRVVRVQKHSGADACRAVNATRAKKSIEAVSITSVHKYIKGVTHARGRVDGRGKSQNILTKAHVKKLLGVRRRIIQKADNETRVTYAEVIEKANLGVECCQRVAENAMRAEGVSYQPARAKVQITEEDAVKRFAFATEWCEKPPSYWTSNIHGFLDCKAWPVPLTPDQRKRYRQTRVTGHLRLPSEGTDRGFTKPRQKHGWLGIPSVNIAAVVSKDRLILFEEVKGSWNGEAAKGMYAELVAPALRKSFPTRRTPLARART
jgi:hypothetical protein